MSIHTAPLAAHLLSPIATHGRSVCGRQPGRTQLVTVTNRDQVTCKVCLRKAPPNLGPCAETSTPESSWPVVQATPTDSSHLTGVTYAAVQTMVTRHPVRNTLSGLATDGNGRTTSVVGIDESLGLVAQHLQVLQAHHAGNSVRDYLPGYIDTGTTIDADGSLRQPRSTTLVWVLS